MQGSMRKTVDSRMYELERESLRAIRGDIVTEELSIHLVIAELIVRTVVKRNTTLERMTRTRKSRFGACKGLLKGSRGTKPRVEVESNADSDDIRLRRDLSSSATASSRPDIVQLGEHFLGLYRPRTRLTEPG